MKVGFIGLGNMGQPMAKNLLKNGYDLSVYDLNPQAVTYLQNAGATAASSITALAESADVIITSVQTSEQVRDLCLNPDGLFTNSKPGLLYIDCSSIDITCAQALHQKAQEHHIKMVDAPVSGGVKGAEAATLTIMVGGALSTYEKAKPILSTLGQRIIHAGGPGMGQAAKICNNLLLAISMLGVSESFTLAQSLGLDPNVFFDISSHSSGQCWAMTSYCPVPNIIENAPSNHNYNPGFMAKMMLKDLHLAQHAAESVNSPIPLGTLTTEWYEQFVNQGKGELDFSAIIQLLQKK